MKKLLLIFLLLSSVLFLNSKTLSVRQLTSAITLDGTGDDDAWTNVQFNDMDQNKGEAANKNNTAKFKMTFDNCDVYVYVEVLDAKIDTSQSKNVWEKDCVEVFFSLDTANQKAATSGQNAFWQCRKIFGREMTDYKEKGFKAEEQDISGGKSQEWKLGWDSLASTIKDKAKWNWCNFRFDIQNGDNDGSGRNSQLFWNSNADDQWNSVYHQGYVVMQRYLKSGSVNCLSDIQQTTPVKSSIKIFTDHIEFADRTNFRIYNSAGVLISQGNKAVNAKISDFKRGIYLVRTSNSYAKFVK